MIKVDQSTKSSFLMFLIGQIFMAIAAFTFLAYIVKSIYFLSLFNLAGFVFDLIAVIKLKDKCKAFKMVYIGSLVNVILATASTAILIISLLVPDTSNNVGLALLITGVTIEAFVALISVFIAYNIMKGCSFIVTTDEHSDYGRRTIYIYISSVIMNIVTRIIFSCNVQFPVAVAFMGVAIGLIVVAQVLFIILIARTYRKLEVVEAPSN